MKRWKKLGTSNGATLVFALVIFLIVSVMSTVLINAVMTSLKSADHQQKEEQKFLSVHSVARLFGEEITSAKEDSERCILVTESEGEEPVYDIGSGWKKEGNPFIFPAVLKSMFLEIQDDPALEHAERQVTVDTPETTGGEQLEQMQEVSIRLTMIPDTYDLTAVFQTTGEEPCKLQVSYTCEMVLERHSSYRRVAGGYTEIVVETRKYHWHIKGRAE